MTELNIRALDPIGQPIPNAIITCYVLDTNLLPCPFEPKIKQQANFYSGAASFAVAMGAAHPGPYFVYGTVQAAGLNTGYFPKNGGFGVPWDGKETLNISVPLSFKHQFKTAPRFWAGNMCGSRVQGVAAVPGGAKDASLVLSWFYDRYDAADRAAIRRAWHVRGLTHVLLSWPDSRSFGQSPQQFLATCQELIGAGFYPCVMLSSKDQDVPDVNAIMNGLVPVLQDLVGIVPMFCVGWELSLWLSPTQVQQLIDQTSTLLKRQPGTLLYVHFQEGYPSFQQAGGIVSDFWNPNVGKLTGLLYQKKLSQNDAEFLDSLKDCLERFGGGFNMIKGFDFVALELTAAQQFNGSCSEAEGDRIGQLAMNAPKVNGVGVMGSGNGGQRWLGNLG